MVTGPSIFAPALPLPSRLCRMQAEARRRVQHCYYFGSSTTCCAPLFASLQGFASLHDPTRTVQPASVRTRALEQQRTQGVRHALARAFVHPRASRWCGVVSLGATPSNKNPKSMHTHSARPTRQVVPSLVPWSEIANNRSTTTRRPLPSCREGMLAPRHVEKV
ncbi:hypothetical protein FA10DRAFT_54330 [Acaromyces ingoldii]|uniref:Uncharacterized protein n=1 Tax=Acaromyces ingoldii TaxID=215250 RepID=A0A316YBE0_9BASI|nr:hypothetical protein FA10DRAFT_54330 [Acaromyces ingoldii]PWN86591.1 hypothetical protein FA10DRAFT_54330 [Acaromyces ingoldii]